MMALNFLLFQIQISMQWKWNEMKNHTLFTEVKCDSWTTDI